MNDERFYAVKTVDGSTATLWSDDTFTLHFGAGFDDEIESTTDMLQSAVSQSSLLDIYQNSKDQNDSQKALAALHEE